MAKYVASNGPQSGEALKQEKYGDPRYAFLFSGEGSTYYQFRLAKEIDNCEYLCLIYYVFRDFTMRKSYFREEKYKIFQTIVF